MTVVNSPVPGAGEPPVNQPPVNPTPAPAPAPAPAPTHPPGGPRPGVLDRKTYATRKAEIESQEGMRDFLNSYHEYEIKPEVRTIHDQYDEQVEKLLGIRRKSGESTYGLIDRVFTDGLVMPKFKVDQLIAAATASGQTLPDAVPGTPAPAPATPPTLVEQQVQALQTQIDTLKKSKETEVEQAQANYHKQAVELVLGSKEVFVPEFVPEAERKAYADSKRAQLVGQFMGRFTTKQENGLTVYYEGDKAMLNEAGQPMNLVDLVGSAFKYELNPGTPPPPTGMGGRQVPAAGGQAGNFKNLEEVILYVHDNLKLKPDSADARTKIKELGKQFL